MDLHDIVRAGRTFGVRGYYVVTPFEDQVKLCGQITAHWTEGEGGRVNPSRKSALQRVRVVETFEDVLGQIEEERQQPVVKIATSAGASDTVRQVSCKRLKEELNGNASHVLVFGTAWGLAEELIDRCDYILDPIAGAGIIQPPLCPVSCIHIFRPTYKWLNVSQKGRKQP